MKVYKEEELKTILKNHLHWLYEDCEGWEYMKANLSYADLSSADLRCANLRSADLSYTNLSYADLSSADLSSADLSSANLRYANLRSADLSYANLSSANLRSANLRYADLSYADFADLRPADLRCANLSSADLSSADLSSADLSYTNLSYADLRSANLSSANLRSADLSYADLRCADLRSAKNMPYVPYACPDFDSFIGWKKCGNYIVQLEILKDARRCSTTGRKCRCDKAKVLAIQNFDGTIADITEVSSNYNKNFIYKVGKIVKEPNFNEDRWNECSTGIHFFINRQEAVNY